MVKAMATTILPNDTTAYLMNLVCTSLERKYGAQTSVAETTLQTVIDTLKVDKPKVKNLPSESIQKSVDAISHIETIHSAYKAEQAMVKLLLLATQSIAKLIIPGIKQVGYSQSSHHSLQNK